MIKLVAAALTDKGLTRDENEDSVWAEVHYTSYHKPVGLFVVCDGMGGHMGGKYASYWAVEAIKREFSDLFFNKDPRATVVLTDEDIKAVQAGKMISPEPTEPDIEVRVQRAIQKANQVVYEYAQHKPNQAADAGTTVSMAVVFGNRAVIANEGDSRTYLLRDHKLKQVSKDHSLVASMVATGQILPNELYTHPQRNVIFRFLGQQGLVQADIFHLWMEPGDYLLLCSDGFWEMVRSDGQIIGTIEKAKDPKQACQSLIDAANEAGGEDNIGVVVVQVT